MNTNFKDDFLGFSFGTGKLDENGEEILVHSSELGIVRTSDGSRFNENLLPTMQDKTVQVPGRDGSYYFGSFYTQRQFTVSFAFDSLTEEQIARLKEVFGDKGIHDLIFDEAPYKIYSAKVTGTATLKHIPFAEGENNRLYKGEGSIQFTCYTPFARCRSTRLDYYYDIPEYQNLTNKQKEDRIFQWWQASKIPAYTSNPDNTNFGDVPVPFKLTISGANNLFINETKVLEWDIPDGKTVVLDTKIGLAKRKKTEDPNDDEIYNEYITGDLTVRIPVGTTVLPGSGQIKFTCLYI